MLFELMDSDLSTYIKDTGPLAADLIQSYLFQILRGVEFCHSRRILHLDLKPQNLLIDQVGNIKIADFGLTQMFNIPLSEKRKNVCTRWYRAPELLLGQKNYSLGVDIWSVGCTLAEIAKGAAFLPGDSEIDQIYRIFQAFGTPFEEQWPGVTSLPFYRSDFPNWVGKEFDDTIKTSLGAKGTDLLAQMLQLNPIRRISARRALQHDYFENFDKSLYPL